MGSEGVGSHSSIQENRNIEWDCLYPFGLVPLVSSPIGVYHVSEGMLYLVLAVSRITATFFVAQTQFWMGEEQEIQFVHEEELNALHEAIDTIARGILEFVPIIGNLAMWKSSWGGKVRLQEECAAKMEDLRSNYVAEKIRADKAEKDFLDFVEKGTWYK